MQGRIFLGLLEEIHDAALGATPTNISNELGTGNERKDPCLTGDGFGQESFAGAWEDRPTTHLWESWPQQL